MVKKIIKISLVILGIGLALFLVLHNLYSFVETTNRFKEIFNINELKNFFEVYNEKSTAIYDESINEIVGAVEGVIDSFEETVDKPFDELLLDLLANTLDFGFNFIIYFCNYGLNVLLISYIFFHETISGTQENIKTSKFTYIYYSIVRSLEFIRIGIIRGLIWLKNFLYKQRRKIALMLLLVIAFNGVLYRILVEVVIFIITYVIRMINLETYLIVFQMVQSLFIFIYPKLKYIPTWIWIPILIITIFLSAVSRANYRLKKNHQRLKDFVKDDLTQTCFINGCPGTGKTLLNMSMSLACEEVFIEELEGKLLDYEMKHKYINFAKVRQNPLQFQEHEEYIRNYHLLNDRKSFIISNYAIYSPLFESYSKIFNFDYMRVNKPANIYPLEEYIVISISEFDKEYNSHDDKKIVGEDGAATFFSTVSHDLKRHAKIFVDYQLRQQVPLRIRGNAEYFITIKERKKKYPLLLIIYYLPFLGLYRLTKSLIKKYESRRRTVAKKSFRKGKSNYKRNDITVIYAILRSIGNHLSKICNWFDQFWYFKLNTRISQEDENDTATKGTKKALCINIRDLSYKNQRLYDSTFLSYSYEEKKNEEFMNLDTFTRVTPSKDELDKCNSRFYNKINH